MANFIKFMHKKIRAFKSHKNIKIVTFAALTSLKIRRI